MKSTFKLSLFLVATLLLTADVSFAQERSGGNGLSPDAMVSQNIFNKTMISVTYGRPGLKGRDMETLAPSNEIWRTGANEATTITFSTDVMFGGQEVAAGTYTLYTIPGDNWSFILNSKLTRSAEDTRPAWGAYGYDESTEVLRVPAAVTVNDAPEMERFAIFFDALTDTKTHLNLHWGTTLTAIPIEIAE